MVSEDLADFTPLLNRAAIDDNAKERLYREVYDELRGIARGLLLGRRHRELQTTVLVNEVVLKFERAGSLKNMTNRRVFFAVATKAMKDVLVDHYRRRSKEVDSPGRQMQPLDLLVERFQNRSGYDLERLSNALDELGETSRRQYAVIMHRFFGELTVSETAELLGVSAATVERDWRLARAKLYRAMKR